MTREFTFKDGTPFKVTAKNKRKSHKWGQEHYAYTIVIENKDGKRYSDTYHDNYNNMARGVGATEKMLKDAIGAMISDAYCYRNNPSFTKFVNAYGGDDEVIGEATKVCAGCLAIYQGLFKLFAEEQLEELYETYA